MTISVPEVKITKTRNMAKVLLNKMPTLREISSFLGMVISQASAFPYAPLYYRHLQFQFCQTIKEANSWDEIIHLHKNALANLLWWEKCPATLPPTSLLAPSPSISLSTDASNSECFFFILRPDCVWPLVRSRIKISYKPFRTVSNKILPSFLQRPLKK